MSAILKFRKQEYEVRSGITVREAMLKLDFVPDAVIATRDGELIAYEEIIGEGETIRLVAVISGGCSIRLVTVISVGGAILGAGIVAMRSVCRSCVGN
jgi:sulfur carrier protein ThiS